MRKFFNLPTLILFVLAVRILFSFLPSFSVDMGTWLSWANRLSTLGFGKFYSEAVWTQYTPGFLYWLWLVGKAGWVNELVIKLPVIVADIATGVLIWKVVKKKNPNFAPIAFLVYVLGPVVIFNGSVWGQIDGIMTLFLFLSVYYLAEKENILLSFFFWAIAFLIKPQAIAIFPVLLLIGFKRYKIVQLLKASFAGLLAIFIGSLAFFPKNPIFGLPQLIQKMSAFYAYTSVFAFNIWSLVGMWKPDSLTFLKIPFVLWGSLFLFLSVIITCVFLWRRVKDKKYYYLAAAILSLAFFVFPTRVHERYIFPFFAFLLTAAGLFKSKKLLEIYFLGQLLNLINLYHPYAYYTKNFLRSEVLLKFTATLAPFIGATFLLIYILLIFWEKLPKLNIFDKLIKFFKSTTSVPKKGFRDVFPKINLSNKISKTLLLAILLSALATRIFSLGSPKNEYFDEVYHAFTARQILNGNSKVWEWWNTPPEGFAYEWTHPPLAKLGMVLGMKIFGDNSFGWRIPGAILGVGTVFLVYLIAKSLFKDEVIGLVSAFIFSLDGLALTMSRIGMNDPYILFFILLAIYLFIKEKDFFSAASFGLALASKWSAFWAAPIFFIIWLVLRKMKLKLSLFWFIILPPLVYLASYIPMFLTKHDLDIFIGVQKQMWWYHTRLKATHPYTSAWWSWPFDVRPVYLYTSEEVGGMVSRIYNLGNPIIFWFGLVSVFVSAVYSFINKNKNLAIIVLSYFIFFVPWALSPRIMFFYHYLPSLPFLAIATGYVLRKQPKLLIGILTIGLLVFIYFYPHWAGLKIPLWLDKSYYWFPSWR